jgi:hypothetical protein
MPASTTFLHASALSPVRPATKNFAWPSLRCASTPHTRSWRSYTARCSAVSSSPAAPAIARIPAKAWGSRLPCARDLIASPIALEKQAVPILARKNWSLSGADILSTAE